MVEFMAIPLSNMGESPVGKARSTEVVRCPNHGLESMDLRFLFAHSLRLWSVVFDIPEDTAYAGGWNLRPQKNPALFQGGVLISL